MKPEKFILFISSALILLILTSFKLDKQFGKDFIEFWTTVKKNYAYFDNKHTDWEKVRDVYLPIAEKVHTKAEFITVLENAIEELYDNHFSLNTNLESSTRLVPSGSDLWAEWIGDKAVVTEVRKDFSADRAGVRAGMEIVSINGRPVDEAVNARVGKCIKRADTEVRNFALRQLLAGTYLVPRIIATKSQQTTKVFNLDKAKGDLTDTYDYPTLLESKLLAEDIGYIRFNNSLGETAVVHTFDSALSKLQRSKAIIIDLRETPGGGNSTVARGILGRFISKDTPYQKHILPMEAKVYGIKRSWLEIVSPRGPFTYSKPVVVLVNHWTGSMGEGIAIGFEATGRATIVGTRMAALNGAINGFELSFSKIPYSFPTEQLYQVSGEPRERYTPKHLVNLVSYNEPRADDTILTEGLRVIKKKLGRS